MTGLLARLRGLLPGTADIPTAGTRPALLPPAIDRPGGPLLWVHLSSKTPIGPLRALLTALDEEYGTLNFLISGLGAEGADLPNLPVLRTMAPGESAGSIRTFLDHWRPDMALMFSTYSPAIAELNQRTIPLYLIAANGTGADKPAKAALRRFDQIFATTEDQAAIALKLGVPPDRVQVVGPLCEGHRPPACNDVEREDFSRLLAGRPTWLALNTSAAEDHVIITAQARAARLAHRLLLILAPSNPARGPDLARTLRKEGWRVALRSADQDPHEETQIYIADTEGEDGLWLRLAPITFLGGTLMPEHTDPADPAAAAALGSAILHGPHSGPFQLLLRQLDTARAARTVRDAESLARTLSLLLAPEKAAELANNAWQVSTLGAETTQRIVQHMLDRLDNAEVA